MGPVAKRDPRSHEFGLAAATPTFPSRLGDSAKTCNASRCATWSVRYRGVLRQQGLHPTFGPDLAHVSLHPSFSGLRCGGLGGLQFSD